jgi:hypothetical protein
MDRNPDGPNPFSTPATIKSTSEAVAAAHSVKTKGNLDTIYINKYLPKLPFGPKPLLNVMPICNCNRCTAIAVQICSNFDPFHTLDEYHPNHNHAFVHCIYFLDIKSVSWETR